jgi:hypothetical protein
MEMKIVKSKTERVVLLFQYQEGMKQKTLSFLPRKRECIKMLDYYLKSAAKVVSFNESGNVLGDFLLQFSKLKICY